MDILQLINNYKDALAIIIAVLSLLVSILAIGLSFTLNLLTSIRVSRFNKSNALRDIHSKIQSGRDSMYDIYNVLCMGKEITEEEFTQYYNNNYHRKEWFTDEKKMSKNIHMYLHELDYMWKRINKYKEFKEKDVMEQLGPGIVMDKELIDFYLKAHWIEHYGEAYDKEVNKFWKDVPRIVKTAEKWHEKYKEK
jgi:hypothetical protein